MLNLFLTVLIRTEQSTVQVFGPQWGWGLLSPTLPLPHLCVGGFLCLLTNEWVPTVRVWVQRY